MCNNNEIKIFAGSASIEFTKTVCEHLGITLGSNSVITFSEGNTYVKINEKVRGLDVYIIQTIGLDPNNEFMELLFWIDAFKRSGVNSVTAIMPFFSYSQADKKDEPRVSIRARVCADCLEIAGVDRVITMDLHSAQIQGFFRKPVDHLYASPFFCDHIKNAGYGDFVIVSPDEGFAKNARFYSHTLNSALAIGNKQRSKHDEKAEVLNIMGDVDGKVAVMIDDFTISCNTLIETAKVLKKNGATKIYAYVSHGLLTEQAVKSLENSVIEKLFTTDTVDNPFLKGSKKIEILTATKMFAEAIKIIQYKESLSELFL